MIRNASVNMMVAVMLIVENVNVLQAGMGISAQKVEDTTLCVCAFMHCARACVCVCVCVRACVCVLILTLNLYISVCPMYSYGIDCSQTCIDCEKNNATCSPDIGVCLCPPDVYGNQCQYRK